MRKLIWMLLALPLLSACNTEKDKGCVDEDADGYGANCDAGDDCNDADPNNWLACSTCVDADSDDTYVGCDVFSTIAGPDCDDADVDNQTSCATCLDGDGDSSFVGCDAYVSRSGPDCDDGDVDNQTSCATCLDSDGDSSFAGCDAYTTRTGPDCNDADVDNQTSCSTCVDGDGDSTFAGCDAYTTRTGPDCRDGDALTFPGAAPNDSAAACMRDADDDDYGDTSAPSGAVAGTDCDDSDVDISPGAAENETGLGCVADADDDGYASTTAPAGGAAGTDCDDDDVDNNASCLTCADLDLDLDYAGCDRYLEIPGPDCDDSDPLRSTIEPELADDGIDNNCSGSDLVASSESGVFVDVNNVNCIDIGATKGTQATPYCSLSTALGDTTVSANIFVASGTYVVRDLTKFLTGPLRIYGGYDGSWSRNLSTNTTIIDSTGMTSWGLLYSGPELVVDGVHWNRTGTGGGRDLVSQGESLSALTRSHFDVPGSTDFNVEFAGVAPHPHRDNDHVLVRDNTFTASSPGYFVYARGHGTFRFVNNEILGSTQSGSSFGVVAESERDFIINNSIRGGSDFYPVLTNPASKVAYIANNSIDVVNGSAIAGFTLRSVDVTLVNNALYTNGNMRLFDALVFGVSTPPDLKALNNIAETGTANFGRRWGTAGTAEHFTTAASLNACSGCIATSGNLDGNISFVDAANGDFRLGATSPGIDGGADPTAHIPFFRIDEDQIGASRPQDGDGLGGPQWDVGALED